MRRIFLVLLTVSFAFHSYAQNSRKDKREEKRARINQLIKEQEEGVIAYRKSFLFGGKLATDGYGIFFELGRASSIKKAMLYQLEISERKHPKEEKQSSIYSNSVPFIYGKENFFYPVKLGVQQQMLLGNKSNKNGVAITANYGGGIALAFLRPYYVQAQKGNGIEYVKYNSPDSLLFLSNQIFGGPSFSKGWSDMKVTPGLYLKAGVRFDYGTFNELISAIEVGVTADYYSKKIPQLVYNPERRFFFGGYVAVMFGKRK